MFVGLGGSIVGIAETLGVTDPVNRYSLNLNPADLNIAAAGLLVPIGGGFIVYKSKLKNEPLIEAEFRQAIGLRKSSYEETIDLETPNN